MDVGERFGALSPGGQNFAVAHYDASTNSARLLLVPVAGGQPREVLQLPQGESLFRPFTWMPDSRALIIEKNTGSNWELWRVPVDGGQLRKLDIDPIIWREGVTNEGSIVLQGDSGFSISPDGHSIALMTGKTVTEIWALENFLPPLTARK